MDVTDSVAANRQRVVGFADVLRIPVRRWRIVLAVAAVVVLAVLGYLFLFPTTYSATTVVVLRPVVTDPFTYPSSGADRAINMNAENGVALGNDVIDATAQVLGREAEDVRSALTVELPTGGQVLRFKYVDDNEDDAVKGANAAAANYLKVRESIYQQQRAGLLLSYDNTMRQVTDQRKAAQKGLPDGFSGSDTVPPKIQAVLDQVGALNDQIAQLANQKAKIASADLSPGSITAAARTPVPSSHDGAKLYLVGGLLGGLLIGMMAAHGREAMDRRVRSLDQAVDLIGVPALGVVRSAGRNSAEAAAADARFVSLAVHTWMKQHPGRPVVVLSGRDDEGRTALAGNLAVALAESGNDVTLSAAPGGHDELRRVLAAGRERSPARARPAKSVPAARKPEATRVNGSPGPAPSGGKGGGPGKGGNRVALAPVAPRTSLDPDATLVMEAPVISPAAVSPGAAATEAALDAWPLVVPIGLGEVRLCSLGEEPAEGLVVTDAPPSDVDERGVRAAQSGVALLVVRRDKTRHRELTRLVDRLRSAGAQTVGFVLTGGRGA